MLVRRIARPQGRHICHSKALSDDCRPTAASWKRLFFLGWQTQLERLTSVAASVDFHVKKSENLSQNGDEMASERLGKYPLKLSLPS